jgi:polyhydroxyalkanoate synthesis regulator phasin
MSTDTLRKIGLFGIGIVVLTQEKLEEFTQEMIKKGEMNREEGKNFVIDILLEKDRQLKEIEEKISNKVKDTIENSGVATKKDIQALEKRLEILEKDITVT